MSSRFDQSQEQLSSSQPAGSSQFLNEEYTIDTPENVTFGYDVAGIGSRFIGALVDSLILAVLLFLLNFVLMLFLTLLLPESSDPFAVLDEGGDGAWAAGIAAAVYILLNFIMLWGYYIFFEMIWRGQTPGKRVAGIRVVRMDGNSIGFLDNAIRNLIRIIDFLPFGYGVGLIVMFCNRHSRRLGDFAAGTLVIHEQKAQTFDDFMGDQQSKVVPQPETQSGEMSNRTHMPIDPFLAQDQPLSAVLSDAMSAPSAAADPLRERFSNIQQLSSLDFELVADTLQRHKSSPVSTGILARLAHLLATKLEMEKPAGDSHQFLTDLAEAYRRYHR